MIMMKKIDICNIADWFLIHESMTHKKLQKLLYFSYGYYLATYNNTVDELNVEMFENDFEAWVHGPVSPRIYNLYREAGYNYISKNDTEPTILTDEIEKVLFFVLNKYKKYDGDELEKITHAQSPWINAREGLLPIEPSNNPILSKDIYTYFKENNMIVE